MNYRPEKVIVTPSPAWFDETNQRFCWGEVPADYEAVPDQHRRYRKSLELAGHGKDSTLIQSRLALYFDPIPENDIPTERVLGGESDTSDGYVKKSAHGWIEFHTVKRERKSGAVWETLQPWLHWEEAGGKKRSRYIPKAKYNAVRESVYELKRPIQETLMLLEKRK